MKLTYWMAACLDDASAYNLRARLKSEVARMKEKQGPDRYGPIRKVTHEYTDGFDLVNECLCEGGGYWEVTR